MFPFHVFVDEAKSWLDYAPAWVTAVAALGTVIVALRIAHNQNRLQKTLAERQLEIQSEQIKLAKMQLDQQAHQLTKDLFDRRFAIFTAVEDFITWVIRSDGDIEFFGPGEYRNWREAVEKAQMLFGEEVIDYMEVADKAARDLYVVVKKMAKNSADMQAIDDQNRLMNQLTITLREQRVEIFRPYLALFHKAVARA
jgi:hypothetical protein